MSVLMIIKQTAAAEAVLGSGDGCVVASTEHI